MEITKEDRILITGGYGFLGRFVFLDLVKNGYYDVYQYGGQKDGYDLGEAAHVGWLFDDVKPDVVIHLAEINGHPSVKYPGGVMFENLNMGLKVIEEARQWDVKKFITVSDYNCYPSSCPVPMRESDLWNGYPSLDISSYAIAKRTFLELSHSYSQQFRDFNTVNLIMPDLYGPSDHFHPHALKFLPTLIAKIKYCMEKGIPTLELSGIPNAEREFLSIKDAARAVRMSMEDCHTSVPINVGTGVSTTIHEAVQMCCKYMGYSGAIKWTESSISGPIKRYLDSNMAKKMFGFDSKITLEEGISEMAKWCIENLPEITTYADQQIPPRRGYAT